MTILVEPERQMVGAPLEMHARHPSKNPRLFRFRYKVGGLFSLEGAGRKMEVSFGPREAN